MMYDIDTSFALVKSEQLNGITGGEVANGSVTPTMPVSASDDENVKLVAISAQIDQLGRTVSLTILQIAARVHEIHEIFRYRRDEGGFSGYINIAKAITEALRAKQTPAR